MYDAIILLKKEIIVLLINLYDIDFYEKVFYGSALSTNTYLTAKLFPNCDILAT